MSSKYKKKFLGTCFAPQIQTERTKRRVSRRVSQRMLQVTGISSVDF